MPFFFNFFFDYFLVKKRPKKTKIQKKLFCSNYFVGKHLHTKFQKISSNGLDFANFFIFFGCFLVKKRPKRPKSKKSFFVSFFCWQTSRFKISESFIKQFGFCQFSSFKINFGCFFGQKITKKAKSKNVFFF